MEDHDKGYQTSKQGDLSHIPLGQLKAMQNKMGLKAFSKIKSGSHEKSSLGAEFKRLNHNRPAEYSSRKPIPRQKISGNKKPTSRDPRFDELSGEYDNNIFKKKYAFLDDIKAKEKTELQKIMKETKDKQEKSKLKVLINRMKQQEKEDQKKEKMKEMEKQWRKEEKQKVLEGKKPYFLKSSEKKARFREQYLKELEETGKMQKYTERKNKKTAAKEKKRQEWKTDGL